MNMSIVLVKLNQYYSDNEHLFTCDFQTCVTLNTFRVIHINK